jgi:hypothetical protein
MSLQFNVNKSLMGDVTVQGGVIIDTTQSPTASILIGHDAGEAVQSDPNTNSYSPAPVPSGGSGRNIIIQKTAYSGLPDGLFFPLTENQWYSSNYGENFVIEYGQIAGPVSEYFTISDLTGVIATAPIGVIDSQFVIPCATAYESGGGTGSLGDAVDYTEKQVYLGASTGIVGLNYDSVIGTCRFVVFFDGSSVIDVSGSGTTQFTKSTSTDVAYIRIYGLTDQIKWDVTLGCPGGGSPPFTPPTTRSTFNATLTTYGLTLTGGVNIPIVCTFEAGTGIKEASVTSDIIGDFQLKSESYQRFYDFDNNEFSLRSNFGLSEIRDNGGAIAIFNSSPGISLDLVDPTGSYESTTYGHNKYNVGVPFNLFVQLNDNPSLTLVHYYVLNLTGGGSISSYEGPISAPTLPANTSTKKHIPVASFDSSINTLLQLWEGPILWR